MKYVVRDRDYDPEWSIEVEARDRLHAAEVAAARVFERREYPTSFDFQVEEADWVGRPGAIPLDVEVDVEPVPFFRASAKQQAKRAGGRR